MGFSALQDLGYVPAALQGSPSDDSTISAEFRVALRKMSKKDATTKIKALQEFEALCGNGDVDSIKTALPFWPRLYAKLTIDVERRVREAAQIAHGALVSQVGKQLAPHLRSIMPSWVMGMVDPHPAASSAALKALQDVFAAEKIAEVMFFSGKEILEHIKDNLFMQTPQTLSDPKTTDEEDMKNKYIHVLVCSLKGISLLLTYTTRNTQKKSDVIALVQPLIQNPKFWKMSKHKHSMVRIAWFSTLSNMFEYDSGLLKCYSEEVSHVILPSLDDHEGAVLPHIWVAFLHLCLMYPALWHEGNNKSVFNRLYSVLRDCGRGSAAELYPHLLPIISIIPEEAVGDKTAFYIDFFRALSTGLNKSRMSLSSRDIHAILKALFECLKYVSMNKTDASLWEILMKYQIIEPLKLSFSDTPALSTSNLYREVSELLRFWTWKSHTEENQEAIGNLLALFWKNFIPECETCIQKGNEATLSKMKDFFTILRDPASKFTSRREGVRFTDESKKVSVDMKEEEDSANQKKKEQVFLEHAAKNIALLTVTCHVAFLETKSTSVYKIFATLLSSFPSDRVYTLLLNKQDEEKVSKLELMEEIIQPKLEIQNPSLAEHTVDIFMGVYTLMSPEEQKLVLLESKIFWSISVLRRLLEKMTERRDTDQVAMSWLLSAQLGNRLIQLVEQLCGSTKSKSVAQYSQDEELVTLFNFVLSNGNKKDHIIAMEYVSQILKNLSFNLKLGEDSEPEDQMVQLVANLASQLFSSYVCWQTTGIQEFMRSLFLLQCQSWKSLSEQTVSTLKSTFLKAFSGLIASLVKEDSAKLLEDGSCLRSTLKDIKQIIMEDKSSFNLTMRMAMLTKNLLSLVYEQVKTQEVCGIMLDHSIIQALLEILAPTEGCWVQMEEQLSPLYMAPAILQGSIAFSEFPFPKKMQETVVWDHKHTRISMFFCDLLLFVCKQKNAEVLEEEEEVSLGQYTHLVVSALHSACHATVVQELYNALSNHSVSDDVKAGTTKLNDDMGALLKLLNQGNKRLITKQIRDRCSDGSSAWCVTLVKVLNIWMKAEDVNIMRLLNGIEESALGYIATKQSLLPLLPNEPLMDILAEEMGKLSSLEDSPYLATPCISLITTALSHVPSTVTKDVIGSLFSVLTQWRENADNIFLYATDISGMAWEDVVFTCSLVRLVTVLVNRHSMHLEAQHWDFILCSLCSWAQSLEESRLSISVETVSGTFTCAVSKCAGCVSEVMENLKANPDLQKSYPPNLLEDWKEFFSASIYNSLLPIFIEVAASYNTTPTVILYGVCRALCIGVCRAGTDELANHTLPALFNADDAEADLKLPDSEQILLNHLAPLLVCSHPPTQYAAYSMLSTALPGIMEQWEKNKTVIKEEEDISQRPLPYAITRCIMECGSIVEASLADKEMGDECIVVPYTDSHIYIAGYLLAWRLALNALTHASDANQHQYSAYFRQSNLLQKLLCNLFKLMPRAPLVERVKQDNGKEDKVPSTMFSTELHINPTTKVTSRLVAHLACKVYYDCTSRIPAAVRQWFISLERHFQQVVDPFTATYVSPLLIAQEMAAVSNSFMKFDNMTVKARTGAREVVATYTIDEASMEIVLRMAPNHPLSTIVVEDHRRLGVSVAQWRNWLLGLNTMLSHRNTPLMQSLAFWKKNVDQKFEGIEECYICYYVLHGTNHQLPKLLCRTCKKKFHSACLYKWFNSSNNSTCPLCRALF